MALGPAAGAINCSATTKSVAAGGTGKPPTARRCHPPLGGDETGPDPTNWGKLGTKRQVLSDRRGLPLGVVVSAANRHDMKVATATLASVVVARPAPTAAAAPHRCRDKGFDYPATRAAATARGYRVHPPQRGLAPPSPPPGQRFPARRWVVERTNSWHNRFRKRKIRYEKHAANYLGLLHYACFLLVYRARLTVARWVLG